MKKVFYNFKREIGQNPFIGFTTYQGFYGEDMFSDIVAGSGPLASIETESSECYPVDKKVKSVKRTDAYYPDGKIAYIRILWRDFEPERGHYNYKVIRDILDKAKEHGQTVMFRLMPHSTREKDDVPDWLKKIIECPKRPDGARIKDSPTDKRYLEVFAETIEKLGEHFDDDETLDIIDVCLPGAWGEGHEVEKHDRAALLNLMDTYARAFKKTILLAQICAPDLINYLSEQTAVGWRGDGVGSPKHMNELFPYFIGNMKEGLWKTAPVAFESYWWLCEWQRHGWDIDEIIEKTLEWHVSNFNAKSFPIPLDWKEKIEYWLSKMGYHFVIKESEYSETVADTLAFSVTFENVGVAPIYRNIPLKIKLNGNGLEYVFETKTDIRKWLPGCHKESFEISLPKNLPNGEYDVKVGIEDENRFIYFASDAPFDGKFYTLFSVKISL